MKRALFIIIIIFAAQHLSGQKAAISLTGGVGFYEMDDLIDYQDRLIARLPVEAKAFSYFPPYTNLRFSIFRQQPSSLEYGLVYAYSASGAHANYTDYSGYLDLNQKLSSYQFGANISYNLLSMDFLVTRFEIRAYGDLRISFITNKVIMDISTNNYFESNQLRMNAVSPVGEVGLSGMFTINTLSVGVEGGYLLDTRGRYTHGNESNFNSVVSLDPPDNIRSNISGFRLGIKLVHWFSMDFSSVQTQ
jgi:hypothetical protein